MLEQSKKQYQQIPFSSVILKFLSLLNSFLSNTSQIWDLAVA